MRTDDFDYPLPRELVAQIPLEPRDSSRLLMLVSALAGRERVLEAYREAVRERYRFYSFGDCMMVL